MEKVPEIKGKFRIGQILERQITEGSASFREQCLVVAVRAVGPDGSIAAVTSTVRAAKTLQLLTERDVDWSIEPSGLNWHPVRGLSTEDAIQALAESVLQLTTDADDLQSRLASVEGRFSVMSKYVDKIGVAVLALQQKAEKPAPTPTPKKSAEQAKEK